LFIAFSTANPGVATPAKPTHAVQTIPNDRLDPILNATVQAVEEAIINSIVANQPMTGVEGRKVIALPHDRVRDALKKYGRLP
jgi:L-aminopeptidase/D-esterase-like protein